MPDTGKLCFLHLSPHPDDEAIGAPASLLSLREAGHRVINLACSLGGPGQARRRRKEVQLACERAGFELQVHEPPLRIGGHDDRDAAQRRLIATIGARLESEPVDVIVAPSPHDGHHGHEVVGRAARDAIGRATGQRPRLWLWGLWADLPWPTLYFGFDDARLRQAIDVLEAHRGELRRNDYRIVVRGRASANRSLGSERVFGWGTPARPEPYAELLMELLFRDGEWWTNGARALEPADPLGDPADTHKGGRPIGWWLRGASFIDTIGRNSE
jgi:LmbE family N-acetylglucosaminyl deacetylase